MSAEVEQANINIAVDEDVIVRRQQGGNSIEQFFASILAWKTTWDSLQ